MKHSTNQHNINTTVRLGCWHCTWFSSHFKEQLYQNINLHSLFSIMSHSSSSPFHLWINLDLLHSSTTVPKPLNRFLRFPYKHLLDVIIIGLRHFGSVLFCSEALATELRVSPWITHAANAHRVAAALFLYNPLFYHPTHATSSSSVPNDQPGVVPSNKDTCNHTAYLFNSISILISYKL